LRDVQGQIDRHPSKDFTEIRMRGKKPRFWNTKLWTSAFIEFSVMTERSPQSHNELVTEWTQPLSVSRFKPHEKPGNGLVSQKLSH